MSRYVTLLVLLAIVLVMAAVAFRVLAGFLLPMFLAVLLVVIFQPLHAALRRRLAPRERLAAAATTALILLIVLLPLALLFLRAGSEALALARHPQLQVRLEALLERLGVLRLPKAGRDAVHALNESLSLLQTRPLPATVGGHHFPATMADLRAAADAVEAALLANGDEPPRALTPEQEAAFAELRRAIDDLERSPAGAQLDEAVLALGERIDQLQRALPASTLLSWLPQSGSLLGGPQQWQNVRSVLLSLSGPALQGVQWVGGVVLGLGVMILSLYYFLADGPQMLAAIGRLTPLEVRYREQLLLEFAQLSRAVVVANLASAAVQGVLAGAAYFVLGLQPLFFLTLATMSLALVPFVGAAAVWAPAALWLLLMEQRTGAAIGLALYGALVISMADNLIKPWVLHGRSNLHPLLALLSVLGGVGALGPIGIVVGPMVIAFLHTLLVMTNTELRRLGESAPGPAPARPGRK